MKKSDFSSVTTYVIVSAYIIKIHVVQTAAQKSHPSSLADAVVDQSQDSDMVLQFHSPYSLASDTTHFNPICASSSNLLKTWGIKTRKKGRMRKVCNSPEVRGGIIKAVNCLFFNYRSSTVSCFFFFILGVHHINVISRASQLSCITWQRLNFRLHIISHYTPAEHTAQISMVFSSFHLMFLAFL